MDVLPTTCYESVKRYWRRRKYQRVHGSRLLRKKLKIVRLGGTRQTAGAAATTAADSISAVKAWSKGGYMGMVFGLFGQKALLNGKRNAHLVSVGSTGEEVDSRTVMAIYSKFAASRARESGSYI